MVKTVYLSLGSNLGERERKLESAIERLKSAGVNVRRVSSIYETEPIGFRDQPFFLNLAAEAETELLPLMLLSKTQRIERELGRRTGGPPKGPRPIDIDILLYGAFRIHSGRLTIPHPRMHERRFVLAPLAELAPTLQIPGIPKSIRELLSDLADQQVTKRNSFLVHKL